MIDTPTSLRFLNTFTASVLAAVEEASLDLPPDWSIVVNQESVVVLTNPDQVPFYLHLRHNMSVDVPFRHWDTLAEAVNHFVHMGARRAR